MFRSLAIAFLVFLTLGLPQPSFAAARLALVLGNGDYEFGRLRNPVNDANLMTQSLRDVGFTVFEYKNADARTMKRAIVKFGKSLEEAGEDAVGLVYYAGHGFQYNGENYMIPIGAEIQSEIDVDIEGVRASTLLAALDRAGNRLNMVILDACRNNPFGVSTRSAANGLARMDAPTGTLVAYSTAPGNVAIDGQGRNSPYTRALARAIKSPGASVEDVFKTVRVSVMERTNDQQVPWEASSLTGDFFFVDRENGSGGTAASTVDGDTSAEIEYWRSISDSSNPELFRSYLLNFPNGLFVAIAEERLEQLTGARPVTTESEVSYFQSIQNSTDPADFEAYLAAYPNGAFAEIANRRIQQLESKAAQQALAWDRQIEKQLWDEVKSSSDTVLIETFLARYPDGVYADLARARLTTVRSGPLPGTGAQVAAASPALSAPVKSPFWKGTARTRGPSAWGVQWCNGRFDLDMTMTVEAGAAVGEIFFRNGGSIKFKGDHVNNGFSAVVRIERNRFWIKGNIRDGRITGKIDSKEYGDQCTAEFSLTNRAQPATPTAGLLTEQQVASASPAATIAPNHTSWKGVARTGGVSLWGVHWCNGSFDLPMTLTAQAGAVRTEISLRSGQTATFGGSYKDGRFKGILFIEGHRYMINGTITASEIAGEIVSPNHSGHCGAKFSLSPSAG